MKSIAAHSIGINVIRLSAHLFESISLQVRACSWLGVEMLNFISEDMVKDGFEDIMNTDISNVAIEMMKKKHEHVPQLKLVMLFSPLFINMFLQSYPDMQMDVRDMSFFPDDSFDSVIDKGTLDSLMCGTDAPFSASQMLGEVSRLLKPGGVYMLITYGDPTVRMPHISRPVYNWQIELYIIPRPGFQRPAGPNELKPLLEPIPLTEKGLLPEDYVIEDPDSHFIYVCKKIAEPTEFDNKSEVFLTDIAMEG
ncbi:hypothetical protein CASFOL_028515 [Castilleja foliolosa]|uniref:Methyltransferase type 11 domain-containing protein n=1 Tax=Castilleja foliolosa TaxID=1961234 RepID=A0ABD3CEL9_9LAMI